MNFSSFQDTSKNETDLPVIIYGSSTINDLREAYDILEPIGTGSSSVVNLAFNRLTCHNVAVKIQRKDNMNLNTERALRREVSVLSSLSHPNIVQFIDFYEDKLQFYVIMEYLPGGNLLDRIILRSVYTEKVARSAMRVLVSAVHYLHEINIVHRDLKPENLLMTSCDDDADMKIIDFGFAIKAKGRILTTQCGTPGYIAPEIVTEHLKYGQEVDMWSIGVILFILLCGYPPFEDDDRNILFSKIRIGKYEMTGNSWDQVSDEAKQLLNSLLVVDPDKRLTAKQMIDHRWFQESDDTLDSYTLDKAKSLIQHKISRLNKFRSVAYAVIAMNRWRSFTDSGKTLISTPKIHPTNCDTIWESHLEIID